MKLRELILHRRDSLRFRRASHEIVKYEPQYYDEDGVYHRDEWTCFSDVGKVYEGKVVTMEDYLDIENRFIDITRTILEVADCKYVTFGFVEKWGRRGLKEGMRVRVQDLDPFLRMALRGKAFIVFINKSNGIQFDFSEDVMYMHLNCRIPDDKLRDIVESRGLYFDPRTKRILISHDDSCTIYYFPKNS